MASCRKEQDPKRLLIYLPGTAADALPALRLVARSFPDAERLLLTSSGQGGAGDPVAEILEGSGLVHGFHELPPGERPILLLPVLWRRVRSLQADALVYLGRPRSAAGEMLEAALFRLCGIGRLIGVPFGREVRECRYLGSGRFEYEGVRLARCLSTLGDARAGERASRDLGLDAREMRQAAERVRDLSCSGPLVAVGVGADSEAQQWGYARWSELISLLGGRFPECCLVMVGLQADRALSEQLLRYWEGRSVNLCGSVSLRVAAGVMAHARLFVGHEGACMHMAAAAGTPCVAVFSSRTRPGERYPAGEGHAVLQVALPCQGCRLDACREHDRRCLRLIPVDAVLDEMTKILAEPGESSCLPYPEPAEGCRDGIHATIEHF